MIAIYWGASACRPSHSHDWRERRIISCGSMTVRLRRDTRDIRRRYMWIIR
jgi:hypothetical protein